MDKETEWIQLIKTTSYNHFRSQGKSVIVTFTGHFTDEMFAAVAQYRLRGATVQLCYYDELSHQTKVRLKEPYFVKPREING